MFDAQCPLSLHNKLSHCEVTINYIIIGKNVQFICTKEEKDLQLTKKNLRVRTLLQAETMYVSEKICEEHDLPMER